jgi:hypothetical protein
MGEQARIREARRLERTREPRRFCQPIYTWRVRLALNQMRRKYGTRRRMLSPIMRRFGLVERAEKAVIERVLLGILAMSSPSERRRERNRRKAARRRARR